MNGITNEGLTRIVLRPSNRLVTGGIAAICLATWMFAGVDFLQKVRANSTYDAHITADLFSLLWILVAAFFVFAMSWTALGSQLISAHDGHLTVVRKIGSFALGKEKSFVISKIENLRVEQRIYKARGNKWIRYAITFNYCGEESDLVEQSTEARAEELLHSVLLALKSS